MTPPRTMSSNQVMGISIYICRNMTNIQSVLSTQRRLRSDLADPPSAQSDQSSLCAQWTARDPRYIHADGEDSDQTARMLRLI